LRSYIAVYAMSPTSLLSRLAVLAILATSSQAQEAEPEAPRLLVVRSAGTWDFPGGSTIEVTRRLFHGSDMMTRATIYWPQTKTRKACHFVVHVAADAFANREPWLLAFSPNDPILWVVCGQMGRLVDGKPLVARVQRVDLAKPEAIRATSAIGSGPVGFAPQRLVDAIEPHMVMPAANQHALDENVSVATEDQVIEVLYRLRVLAKDGQPLAGVPVRFPVMLASKVQHKRAKAPPPHALHAPSNSGLDIVHAVSSSDGYVTVLIPVAARARDAGAFVRPAITSFVGETAPPIAHSAIRKLEVLHLTKDAIETQNQPRQQPKHEGQLVGHVFDLAGQPLTDCTICIAAADCTTPTIQPRLDRTSKHGQFSIRKLSCQHPMRLTIRHGKQCTTLATTVTPTLAAQTKQRSLQLELGKAVDGKTWTLKLRNP
tara:strand:+ start:845 stop:2134 length:1290 start_codon:yes stop_codon:yes gene_type:complete